MKAWLSALVIAATFLLPQGSRAATIFSDNFDTESLGPNYTGFSQWTVSDGTVDLIGQPSFHDFLPGNGRYVDLDGSTGNAGIMRSSALSLQGGVSYNLTFSLAGSQRGDTNVVTYGIDLNSDGVLEHFGTQALLSPAPFQIFSLSFTPGSSTGIGRIQFGQSGGDDRGLLLDNVALSVSPVPLPGSLFLFGAGIAGLAAWRRRQSQQQTL